MTPFYLFTQVKHNSAGKLMVDLGKSEG